MALSIKNTETERLARELATATGQGITEAVTTALRQSLAAARSSPDRRESVLGELRRISSDAAARWPADQRAALHGDQLYDEQGLPR